MQASSIMSSPVITVGPQTPVPDIAALLFKTRISAVPVLEAGQLVGIVSEGDLLHRHELGGVHGVDDRRRLIEPLPMV